MNLSQSRLLPLSYASLFLIVHISKKEEIVYAGDLGNLKDVITKESLPGILTKELQDDSSSNIESFLFETASTGSIWSPLTSHKHVCSNWLTTKKFFAAGSYPLGHFVFHFEHDPYWENVQNWLIQSLTKQPDNNDTKQVFSFLYRKYLSRDVFLQYVIAVLLQSFFKYHLSRCSPYSGEEISDLDYSENVSALLKPLYYIGITDDYIARPMEISEKTTPIPHIYRSSRHKEAIWNLLRFEQSEYFIMPAYSPIDLRRYCFSVLEERELVVNRCQECQSIFVTDTMQRILCSTECATKRSYRQRGKYQSGAIQRAYKSKRESCRNRINSAKKHGLLFGEKLAYTEHFQAEFFAKSLYKKRELEAMVMQGIMTEKAALSEFHSWAFNELIVLEDFINSLAKQK